MSQHQLMGFIHCSCFSLKKRMIDICNLGDISNPEKTKYSLAYYLNLADELITNGAHVLCIKVISLFGFKINMLLVVLE